MEIDRREFLRLLGITAASSAVAGWVASELLSVPDEVFERVMSGPRIETWKNTICAMCGAGCGIRVRLIDGIPVRVAGNPIYPINRGGVCPKAEAVVELLFHPDRIRAPMKRTGRRGENRWVAISWEEALGTVADRLDKLRENGEPEKLVLLQREKNELFSDLVNRFMSAFGSPNYFAIEQTGAAALPARLAMGLDEEPAYDLANADFVLNFDADLLDEEPSPIRFNQLYADIRKRGAKVVHIGSYMSRTAAVSSEWIRIEPGTAAALALAVAHVMIKDGTYDKDFVEGSTFGFSGWTDSEGRTRMGFEELVLEEYYPKRVAGITGVPAGEIVRIAREFAGSKHALAVEGGQVEAATNTLYTVWAVQALNALKGNPGRTGGVLFRGKAPIEFLDETRSPSGRGRPRPRLGSGAPALSFTLDSMPGFLRALQEKDPYGIDVLVLHGAHRLFASARRDELDAAMGNVPFVVSTASFPDETTRYADLVLPDHVFLEKWEMSRNVPGVEFHHAGIQQPVIEPLYRTMHSGDVFLELSRRLGGAAAQALPWNDYEDFIREYAKAIFDSGEGTIVTESVDLSWMRFLKERGWRILEYSTFEEFWELLIEKGGWWDPRDLTSTGMRDFETPSGRYEFYSRILEREFEEKLAGAGSGERAMDALCAELGIEARGDKLFLPHFEKPRFTGEESEYPYLLLVYPVLGNDRETGAELGLLQELRGIHARKYWSRWAEIDPETAAALGLEDGDPVRVVSPYGSVTAEARVTPAVKPETVVMPAFTDRGGGSAYGIMASDRDPLSGRGSLISTRVRVEKAGPRETA